MKPFIKTTKVLSMLLVFVFAISCGDDKEDVKVDDIPSGWTALQKTAFVKACTEGTSEVEARTEEECSCVFDTVSKDYTFTEYSNITIEQGISLAFALLPCYNTSL